MHGGGVWRLGHRPALDGLRGVAVAIVVVAHSHLRVAPYGVVGVTVFFCLSGFLVTTLLLEERRSTGRVSLRGFWRRRALRLLPALVAMMAFLAVTGRGPSTVGTVSILTYWSNWLLADGGLLKSVNHLWSLAIEEQFYVAWPLALVAVLRTRPSALLPAIAGLAVAGAAWRITAFALWGADRAYYGSDTNVFAMLAGCALAIATVQRRRVAISRPIAHLALAVIVVLATAALDETGVVYGWQAWMPVVVTALTIAVITTAVTSGMPLLETAPLRWLGTRSYGIYLWHFPIFLGWGIQAATPSRAAWLTLVSLVVAEASYRLVEQPILRRWRLPRASLPPGEHDHRSSSDATGALTEAAVAE